MRDVVIFKSCAGHKSSAGPYVAKRRVMENKTEKPWADLIRKGTTTSPNSVLALSQPKDSNKDGESMLEKHSSDSSNIIITHDVHKVFKETREKQFYIYFDSLKGCSHYA